MITDGIYDGRGREFGKCQLNVLLYGEMGKDLSPHLFQPFLENINGVTCNDGI